jgi:hypothetical protein
LQGFALGVARLHRIVSGSLEAGRGPDQESDARDQDEGEPHEAAHDLTELVHPEAGRARRPKLAALAAARRGSRLPGPWFESGAIGGGPGWTRREVKVGLPGNPGCWLGSRVPSSLKA